MGNKDKQSCSFFKKCSTNSHRINYNSHLPSIILFEVTTDIWIFGNLKIETLIFEDSVVKNKKHNKSAIAIYYQKRVPSHVQKNLSKLL